MIANLITELNKGYLITQYVEIVRELRKQLPGTTDTDIITAAAAVQTNIVIMSKPSLSTRSARIAAARAKSSRNKPK